MPVAGSHASEFQPADSSPGLRSTIEVRQDRATRWLAVFFGLLIAGLVAGLWLGSFAKQQPVRGYVSSVSGVVRIASPAAGLVTQTAVRQGQVVRKGQTLLTVRPPEVAAGKERTRAVEQANLERRKSNLTAEVGRLDKLVLRLSRDKDSLVRSNEELVATFARQERDIQKLQRDSARYLDRLRPLLVSRDITKERVSNHERILRDYERQLMELAIRQTENSREHTQRLAEIEASLAEKSNQRAAFANELAVVETELNQSKASEEFTIVATSDGIVASAVAQPGSNVEAGQAVVVLGDPEAEQIIVLEVPAGAMGLVREGQRVTLKYDAFPYKTFGVKHGTVTAVARASSDVPEPGTLADGGGAGAVTAQKQTTFHVTVKPDSKTILAYGEERPIALGSTLTADITIERRRLIDWVIDPILALRGRS